MQDFKRVTVEKELQEAYLDYSMSVIVGRALPDARDGLKPVHRRILFTMWDMGLKNDKPFVKSARIVGDCFKYHPHGDAPIYESLVRMAQSFSLRYPLVAGHGNFGCFTGDIKIRLLDGTSKSFEELSKLYKNNEIFYVYSVDKEGNIVVGEARNPRRTKKDAKLIEVTLDTGEKIRCTLDHRFLLKDRTYKEAKDLTSDDSLMPGYFRLSPMRGNTELKDYLMIKDNKKEAYIFVHEIADKYNLDKKIYSAAEGSIRHHIDFNKFNNDPDNIKRLSWTEHTEIHNKHIKILWQNKGFRKRQVEGIKAFYKNNPDHAEKLRQMLIVRNKDKAFIEKSSKKRKEIWSDPKKREENSKKVKKNFEEYPERLKAISEFSKKMWLDPKKRADIIRRIKEAINTKAVKEAKSKAIKDYITKHPEFKLIVSERFKEYYKANPEAKKNISTRSKKLWKDSNYRSKFVNPYYNHFSSMSKKLWMDQKFRELQTKRVKQLWTNEEFRKNIVNSVRNSNLRRLEKDPAYMKKLAEKSAISHKINWRKPEYKNRVIRSRVLYYVKRLIATVGEENISSETYNQHRVNNTFPRFENAIKYFKNINEMISLAKEYNHHVISVKFLDYTEDVYDITVDKYHNFLLDCGVFVHNSIDFPEPAQMRYSEAKLSKIAEELLFDIEKETVNFIPNFDGSLKEPLVLPARLPNLLINGSSGIAVGMATNIPPHNIKETCNALLALLQNPSIDIHEIIQHIPGPDFPTGGIICGKSGIISAYKTGKGKIRLRGLIEKEERKDRYRLVIKQIPYQVNKPALLEEIANLVNEKTVEGITDIRDESDKDGISIVLDLKRGSDPDVVLKQLFRHSSLETTFGITLLALDHNEPRIHTLKDLLTAYLAHRKEVIIRRTQFDLRKAEARAHILEGLEFALKDIDGVIQGIKASKTVEQARQFLIVQYTLSEEQANAILDMKLQRLTTLETEKITKELEELRLAITDFKNILESEDRIRNIIRVDLEDLREKFNDDRRTIVEDGEEEIDDEELIPEETVAVLLTRSDYIKRMPLEEYKLQRRGGIGIKGTEKKDQDLIEEVFTCSTHDTLLCFSNKGQVYWIKVYLVPETSRYAMGKAIVNLLHLREGESISTVIPITSFESDDALVMATKNGLVKKTRLEEYSRPRSTGIVGIKLREGDELMIVKLCSSQEEIVLATQNGYAVRCEEDDIRESGRVAMGVRGIRVGDGDEVIALEIVKKGETLLTITENGYGKRSLIEDYRLISRGGKGVINIKTSDRNGNVVGVRAVTNDDEVLVISKEGTVIRVLVKDIPILGRNTQGVRIMRLREGDLVATFTRIEGKNEGNNQRED